MAHTTKKQPTIKGLQRKLAETNRKLDMANKTVSDLMQEIEFCRNIIKSLERQLDFKTKAIFRNDEQIAKLKSIVKLQSGLL